MEATKEMEMMKDGAHRVQEFLEAQGIAVKHSMMLEALSAGFGSRNWRTVREKLNSPSAPPAITLDDLGGLQWMVHALYCDDQQPYTDNYPGENGMEAAVFAQVDRLLAESSYEIDVASVVDRLTNKLVDHERGLPSSKIDSHAKALFELAVVAREMLGQVPEDLSPKDKAMLIRKVVAIEVFTTQLDPAPKFSSSNRHYISELNDISTFTKEESDFEMSCKEPCIWTIQTNEVSTRNQEVTLTAPEALGIVLDIVAKEGTSKLKDEHKMLVYHARALLKYAEDELNYVLAN